MENKEQTETVRKEEELKVKVAFDADIEKFTFTLSREEVDRLRKLQS